MKDRLLRPSLVGVSKKVVKKEQNSSENKEKMMKKISKSLVDGKIKHI